MTRNVAPFLFLLATSCASGGGNSGANDFVYLSDSFSEEKLRSDLQDCTAIANENIAEWRKKMGIKPWPTQAYSTGEQIGFVIVGALLAGGGGAAQVMGNVSGETIKEPNHVGYAPVECMQDRNYVVVLLNEEQKERLAAAKTLDEKKVFLKEIYQSKKK